MAREYKPLKIVRRSPTGLVSEDTYAIALSNLAVAEAKLVQAGKDSALPHFIAIVKELEERCGFEFALLDSEPEKRTIQEQDQD